MVLYYLLLPAVLVIVIHIYSRYSREGRLISKINGPKQLFFFGNILDICLPPEKIFSRQIEWRKEHGNLWRVCGLHFRAIYLYRPEDIETVLSSTKYNTKYFPYRFVYPWLREGLLTSAGQKWQHRRKMLTPTFHFLILKKFFVTMCKHTEGLMENISEEVDKDKSDLLSLISNQTLQVICETAMGITIRDKSQKSYSNKYVQALDTLGACVLYRIIRVWLFTDFMYSLTSTSKLEKKALDDLHGFTLNVIKERRKLRDSNYEAEYGDAGEMYGSKAKVAMLDLLLDEEKKGNIDEIGIREEVDTFTFEGHDTTATALSFMIMRIANEPEIQNSIYEELRSILGESQRMPTLEDLNQMKYLELCIKESLRIYPSVPFMARYITKDCDIGGYRIPKNTYCHFNVFDIHRNPDIFPEPEKFIPERFLPENMVKIHPYAYIPFSAGPRNCIGQKFAMMELKTVMSNLLLRYKVEPVTTPQELVFKSDLVLRTTRPLYARFRHRNST